VRAPMNGGLKLQDTLFPMHHAVRAMLEQSLVIPQVHKGAAVLIGAGT